MRLRISADLLHRFYSFKNGKYIQDSRIFETQERAQNLSLSFLADLCGAALSENTFSRRKIPPRILRLPIANFE